MTSQHTADPATGAHSLSGAPERLPIEEIIGRYHARIERLDAAGLAHGEIVTTIVAPNWTVAEARGIELPAPLADIAVVGALPGEVIEVEARWRLPWPGRRRKRLKPPMLRVMRVIEAAPERVAAPCPCLRRLRWLPVAAHGLCRAACLED